MSFVGFGREAVSFWDGLAQDNTKSYWHAHKPTYDAAVAGPLAALTQDLSAEFGDIHRFRPQRDVRFSPDKRPYQEFCSMAGSSTHPTGGVLYLQLGPDGLMVAGGAWQPDTATLTRFREAIDDEHIAASFDLARQDMLDLGFDLDGDRLKTAPRGWPRDHPRIEDLRLRNLAWHRIFDLEPWVFQEGCRTVVADSWRVLDRWNLWLGTHLGPLPTSP